MTRTQTTYDFMRKLVFIILIAVCLTVSFSNRFYNIDNRPPHADESEQASVFLNLYRDGQYRYNPNGPHGPTLYYYADTVAKISDELPPDNITIPFLRRLLFPVSLAIMAFYLLFAPYIGRVAAWGACGLFALSTTASLYAGYFVQEIIFALAILGLAQCLWKFLNYPSVSKTVGIGIFAALAQTTKETAIIAYPAIATAAIVAAVVNREIRRNLRDAFFVKSAVKYWCAAALSFFVVFAAFYSSFGGNWRGVIDAFTCYGHFFDKAAGAEHSQGFLYYFKLLGISKSEGIWFGELPVAILIIAGLATAIFDIFKNRDDKKALCAIFMFLSGFITILFLSAIKYKTPWLILSPLTLMFTTGGYVIGRIMQVRNTPLWIFAIAAVSALGYWQFKLDNNALKRYNCDPRNPFIYTHTVRDYTNLIRRIAAAANVSKYGDEIPVAFVTKTSPWPAPWFLRFYPNVGFWSQNIPANFDVFEIVITDPSTDKEIDKLLDKSKFVSEFYGVRKNLIYTIYINKKIFEEITKEK